MIFPLSGGALSVLSQPLSFSLSALSSLLSRPTTSFLFLFLFLSPPPSPAANAALVAFGCVREGTESAMKNAATMIISKGTTSRIILGAASRLNPIEIVIRFNNNNNQPPRAWLMPVIAG